MKLSKLLWLMTFGLFGSDKGSQTKQEKFDAVTPIQKPKVIPKGAMYFHFNNEGESVIGAWPLSETVFSCFARTSANADRKFNAWLEQENLKIKSNEEFEERKRNREIREEEGRQRIL